MRRLLAGIVVMAMAACGGAGEGPPETAAGATARLQVVAGFYPLAEAVQRVGGDHVAVSNLTAAGAEPHDLELTPRQVDRMADADLVVYLGGGFQPAVEETAERQAQRRIDVLERLPAGGDGRDPHVWLDPVLMLAVVDAIEAELAAIAPSAGETFEANATAYRAELTALDEEYRGRLAGCRLRVLVTSHAAFGRLAARYGLEQHAIAGLSPEAEADPARLSELADLVENFGITTVFYETLTSARTAETLAREVGVKTAVLDPIEGLSGDAIERGASYASVMRDNLAALRSALGCPG